MSASVKSVRGRGGFGASDSPFSAARRRDEARFVGGRFEYLGFAGPTGASTGEERLVRGFVAGAFRAAVFRLPAVPFRFLLTGRLPGVAMLPRTPVSYAP
jgi:hypothetical protein